MSQWQSGKRSDAKKIMLKLPEERGDDELYLLDRAQVKALITLSQSIGWMTRHYALPSWANSQAAITDFADETANDLMTPLDFCGQLASCEAELNEIIANAIANSTSVGDAIRDFILNDPTIIERYSNENLVAGKGAPVPPEVSINDTSDLNELWAQCVQLVEYTDDAIVQLLAVLEVQSNNGELVRNAMDSIPMFKYVLDAVPVNAWLDFVDYFLDVIGEEYDSGYDATIPTGSKWLICCKLFCICKPDKVITINRMWDAISSLLSGFAVPNWDNVQELLESLVGVNDNSTIVAYSCFGLMWGVAKLSSFLGLSTVTNKAISIVLEIAKNDANDDWETLCLDCPPDEWCRSISGSDLQTMFTPTGGLGAQASWTGTGYGANNAVIVSRITLEGDLGASHALTSIRVIFSGTNAVGDTNTVTAFSHHFVAMIGSNTFTQNTYIAVSASLQLFDLDVVSSFGTGTPITVQIDEIQITGTGTPPTFGVEC